MLLQHELVCQVVVPSVLYPFDPFPLHDLVRQAESVCVLEEGTPGGSWAETVASRLGPLCRGHTRAPVRAVHSLERPVPAAAALEQEVLVRSDSIERAVREVLRA